MVQKINVCVQLRATMDPCRTCSPVWQVRKLQRTTVNSSINSIALHITITKWCVLVHRFPRAVQIVSWFACMGYICSQTHLGERNLVTLVDSSQKILEPAPQTICLVSRYLARSLCRWKLGQIWLNDYFLHNVYPAVGRPQGKLYR